MKLPKCSRRSNSSSQRPLSIIMSQLQFTTTLLIPISSRRPLWSSVALLPPPSTIIRAMFRARSSPPAPTVALTIRWLSPVPSVRSRMDAAPVLSVTRDAATSTTAVPPFPLSPGWPNMPTRSACKKCFGGAEEYAHAMIFQSDLFCFLRALNFFCNNGSLDKNAYGGMRRPRFYIH